MNLAKYYHTQHPLSNTTKHYRTQQNMIEEKAKLFQHSKKMTLQGSQLNIIDDVAKHYQTEQNIIRYTAKHNFTVQNIAFVQVAKPYCTYQTSLGKKSLLHVPVDYRRQSKTQSDKKSDRQSKTLSGTLFHNAKPVCADETLLAVKSLVHVHSGSLTDLVSLRKVDWGT